MAGKHAIRQQARRLFVFGLAIILMFAGFSLNSLAQDGKRLKKPQTPSLLPPNFPVLRMLDADVDDFIEVVRARAISKVTGKGLSVAVIDTGINKNHVDFIGKIIPGQNFSDEANPSDPTIDLDGHGSNVAGIIAGRQVDPSEAAATQSLHTGIAPDAKIIPLKVFPGGEFDKVNAALQWVLVNHATNHIGAVNMSLGTAENLTSVAGIDDPARNKTIDLIRQLRTKKVAVVVSAGNDFKAFSPNQGMGFPAICQETISVGALFPKDAETIDPPLRVYVDGTILNFAVKGRCTPFSQRLSVAAGGAFQTDIFAPGFNVTSAGPANPSDPASSLRNQTVDDGTSQASPVTCGIVLLLQQHYRDKLGTTDLPSVDLVENCLRASGTFIDLEDNTRMKMTPVQSTAATLNVLNAVKSLKFLDDFLNNTTPALATAQLQKHFSDLLGSGKSAPQVLIDECLNVAKKNDLIDTAAAIRHLNNRFRSDIANIQFQVLHTKEQLSNDLKVLNQSIK
jgi:subtilisin family serine protease